MKTNTTTRPTPMRPISIHRRPRPAPTPANAAQPSLTPPEERRLYTDFLALALYPGMAVRDHDSAA